MVPLLHFVQKRFHLFVSFLPNPIPSRFPWVLFVEKGPLRLFLPGFTVFCRLSWWHRIEDGIRSNKIAKTDGQRLGKLVHKSGFVAVAWTSVI